MVKSDGAVWFTDPPYGIMHDYEGDHGGQEIGGCHVYRVDAATGAVVSVADDFIKPNGLAFSPDEKYLFVADTGGTHRKEDPATSGSSAPATKERVSGGDVFAECASGFFDGFRIDTKGRVWTSAGDGVHCFDPDGTLIGKIRIPETVANVTFGGVEPQPTVHLRDDFALWRLPYGQRLQTGLTQQQNDQPSRRLRLLDNVTTRASR